MCFYKQKTAYEMRICDWSSDVFSSDLPEPEYHPVGGQRLDRRAGNPAWHEAVPSHRPAHRTDRSQPQLPARGESRDDARRAGGAGADRTVGPAKSEERRVGTECASTWRSRWSQNHKKKKTKKQT